VSSRGGEREGGSNNSRKPKKGTELQHIKKKVGPKGTVRRGESKRFRVVEGWWWGRGDLALKIKQKNRGKKKGKSKKDGAIFSRNEGVTKVRLTAKETGTSGQKKRAWVERGVSVLAQKSSQKKRGGNEK